jgi:hypothetical protein
MKSIDWVHSSIYDNLLFKDQRTSRRLTDAFVKRFPGTDLDIFSDLEVAYTASILKQNKEDANLNEVKTIFDKAIRTLKMKTNELLLQKSFQSIADMYLKGGQA